MISFARTKDLAAGFEERKLPYCANDNIVSHGDRRWKLVLFARLLHKSFIEHLGMEANYLLFSLVSH